MIDNIHTQKEIKLPAKMTLYFGFKIVLVLEFVLLSDLLRISGHLTGSVEREQF